MSNELFETVEKASWKVSSWKATSWLLEFK